MKTKSAAQPELVLNRIAQMKALADPIRYQIFEALTSEARTAKQLAERFRMKPTRLYHHFRVLEDAGLIRKTKTRKVRGTTEKYYEAVAQKVILDPNILGEKVVPLHSLFASAFQSTLEEVMQLEREAADASIEPQIVLNRLRIRTTPAKARALEAKLHKWIEACQAASTEERGDEYGVTVAFYESPRSYQTQNSETPHET